MQEDDYQHINDAFYNEIEIALDYNTEVTIIYSENEEEKVTTGIIDEVYQNENGEFIQLDNNVTIRLDKIKKFNNFFPENLAHIHTFGFAEI